MVCESAAKKRKSFFYGLDHLVFKLEYSWIKKLQVFSAWGIPFNLVRNLSYHWSCQFITANKIDDYVLSVYNKLQTTLSQEEKKQCWTEIDMKRKKVMIMSDSWSDHVRNSLINFIDTSGSGHVLSSLRLRIVQMKWEKNYSLKNWWGKLFIKTVIKALYK